MPETAEVVEIEETPDSDVREDIADLQIAFVELAEVVDAIIDDDPAVDEELHEDVDDALAELFGE